MKIPFNKVHLQGKEIEYASEAVNKFHISGDGHFTKKCSDLLETTLNIPRALLTTSCTHALEMSAILANVQPGDEVIIPSFTFVSTVNAFILRGAVPVFIDIRPDTLNLDESQLEKRKEIQLKRKTIWEYYYKNLSSWAKKNSISLPYIPEHCEQTYHMFYMLFPSLSIRAKFLKMIRGKGINCVFHYLPLNDSIMGNKYGWGKGDCPVTEDISDRLVRFPFYNNLLPKINYVIDNVINFRV